MKTIPVRLPLAAVLLLIFAGPTFAQSQDRAPSTPTGLAADVYSRTAGAVSWRRSTDDRGAVRGYEITRDGRVLDTRDALSYVDSGLELGTTYVYGVTAIDGAGQRSGTARIRLTTLGGSGDGAPASGLAAPSNLIGRVYSSSAAEVSWARPTTFGLRYDILRDGAEVATTDGISYYDATLSAGRSYTYEVIAVDRQGRRSVASSILLNTPDRRGPTPNTADEPAVPATPALAAPDGLRADIYSSTSAELMWTRPARFGLSYEISRNGTIVETTDGISYYDDSLSAGTRYTYQVVALDRQGQRSAPSTVIVRTTDNGEAPAIPMEPPTTEPPTPERPTMGPIASWQPTSSLRDLMVPAGIHERDGYGDIDVVRFDVETVTTPGPCSIDDQSGCTLADVIADVDPDDDFKVDIPVHFVSPDFPEDGRETNAEMRQRGATSRTADQKSFRVEFKGKGVKWREEDKLQINKHPFDPSKIRNKLAFDLMARIPNFPSSSTQFVNLWIDDGNGPLDYGVFTHTEASSEEYFEQRDWDEAGKFYKAEKFLFSAEDLQFMELDSDGKPDDKDDFESRLEIQFEGDNDHRVLIEMVRAINDQSRDFDDVLDQYFDRDNLVTWVAVNILLRHLDAITHNWYLYNPGGSEKFYILPWDYDQTFGVEPEPASGFETEALEQRLFYGFGKARASNLLRMLYRQPGFYEALLTKADTLRNGPFAQSTVDSLAETYTDVIGPVALRGPDEYKYKPEQSNTFGRDIGRSLNALRGGYLPFPPRLSEPRVRDDMVEFRWNNAHDITERRTLSYDLEVATTPEFRREDQLLLETRIANEGDRISFEVPVGRLGSGQRYVRLVVRVDDDPARLWQIASNREMIDGELRIGILEFRIP